MKTKTGRTFHWEGDRNASLAQAKRDGCALSLWFRFAEARDNYRSEFGAWLKAVHAQYGSRFGRAWS
jgi:hypothetical protein